MVFCPGGTPFFVKGIFIIYRIHLMQNDGSECSISMAHCSCSIGLSGICAHVTGLLFQIANFQLKKLQTIPLDIAKTSCPQTWHVTRGPKIQAVSVDNLTLHGRGNYGATGSSKKARVGSTLYKPTEGELNYNLLVESLKEVDPNILIGTVFSNECEEKCATKFGGYIRGSVLSYQQCLPSSYVLNVPEIEFPSLPFMNVINNNYQVVLTQPCFVKVQQLCVTQEESIILEEITRNQNENPLWHELRKIRLTASQAGDVFKRRSNHEKLAENIRKKRILTAAMKHGLDMEPIAAKAYSDLSGKSVNLYPCGLIVNPSAPWLGATPDRKVYNPARIPVFGLLEIKCPVAPSFVELPYISKDETGLYRLKKNHNYYYQVLMQMAVSGLLWCDFYVYCEKDTFLETVYFKQSDWDELKDKLDIFYFSYFLDYVN